MVMAAALDRAKSDFTQDTVSDNAKSQYTSFEKGKKEDAKKEKAEEKEVPMKEYTVEEDNIVTFFGRKSFLSTFYRAPMLICGQEYLSVEHYYEACKVYALCGPHMAMYLKNVKDSGDVKSTAKQLLYSANVGKKMQEKWKKSDGLLVVRVALMEKFRQKETLRNRLLDTKDNILVQNNKYDILWASGMEQVDWDKWVKDNTGLKIQVPAIIDAKTVNKVPTVGKGKNLLGFIQMYVRECIRSEFGLLSLDSLKISEAGDASSDEKKEEKSDDDKGTDSSETKAEKKKKSKK